MLTLQIAREMYEVSRAIGSARTPEAALRELLQFSLLERATCAAVYTFGQPWEQLPPAAATVLAGWHRDGTGAAKPGTRFVLADYGLSGLLKRNEPVMATGLPTVGKGSLLLFPLVAHNTCSGMLLLYVPPPAFRAETLSHIGGLVHQMAAAIYMMRLLKREAQARREAEKAKQRQLRLLATISHELRMPLTSIQGYASSLLATDVTWDAATQRDFIETISREADRLKRLADQLLDHAGLETGTLRVQPQRTSLRHALELAAPRLHVLTAHHRLVTNIPPRLPDVTADPERLAQVIVNLVSNSVKYSPEQTRITIAAHNGRRTVRVDVSDEGPGIPPAERRRIFEPFYQAGSSAGHSVSGAGLGLTICKGIVEAQGGRIWVGRPPEGQGARLSFTLPVYDAE